MSDLFALIPLNLFVLACIVTFVGGFVKGAIGFAMPLIMVSGMSLFLPPPLIVAGIIVPILLTNIWQAARSGHVAALAAMADHWRFILVACVTILIAAQFLLVVPVRTLYLVLGVPVIILCLTQLAGWRPLVPQQWRRAFEWTAGVTAGITGGLTGTWGPPTTLYLLALQIPRVQQMPVQGVIYGLGSAMLLVGHLQSGVLNWETLPFSLALIPPALIGMAIGFRLGDRIDAELFRRAMLVVLLFAGINLVRRGLF